MRYRSTEDLVTGLAARRPSVIAVDGVPGGGKSTLARRIADALGFRCVHLDDFLEPHRGTFLANLDYARLRRALAEPPLVVEGVCVLSVLERLGVDRDALVFVEGERPGGHESVAEFLHEVDHYLSAYDPRRKADYLIDMSPERESWRFQVDVAYINAKARIAVVLAAGGILAILVGAVVFVLGAQGDDTSTIRIAGLEVSATGLGAVILATSAVWGYLAYLASPKYSRTRETVRSEESGGATAVREIESSTMIAVSRDKAGGLLPRE